MHSTFPALGLQAYTPGIRFRQLGRFESTDAGRAAAVDTLAAEYGLNQTWRTNTKARIMLNPRTQRRRGECRAFPMHDRQGQGVLEVLAYHAEGNPVIAVHAQGHEETHALRMLQQSYLLARNLPHRAAQFILEREGQQVSRVEEEIIAEIGGLYAAERKGLLERSVRSVTWDNLFDDAFKLYADGNRALELYELNRCSRV